MNNLTEFCAMKLHIGELVKNKALKKNFSIPDLAKAIPTGKRNMYRLLGETDMLVSQLYKISKALDYDFFKDINPLAETSPLEETTDSKTVVNETEVAYKKAGKEFTIHFEVGYSMEDAENLGAFMMHVDALGEQFGFKLR